MKSSVIITNYRTDHEMKPLIWKCIESFWGKADEVIMVSSKKSSLGEKINQGGKMSKGEYIIITNDDIELLTPLDGLFVPGTVTSPMINGSMGNKKFHAHMFCMPREVFESVGGYSEEYENAYFDDDDFIKRCEEKDIPMIRVKSVDVSHPVGGTTLKKIEGDFYTKNEVLFKQKWGSK